ncbi:hypothetical protein ACOMHN_009667 [Nucella lapillus]
MMRGGTRPEELMGGVVVMVAGVLLLMSASVKPTEAKEVRLQNGTKTDKYQTGRPEIQDGDGQWKTLCNEHYDEEAGAICRMLGFRNGLMVDTAYYGNGTAWYPGRFYCGNDVENLTMCSEYQVSGDCIAAGVVCFNKFDDALSLRLAGGAKAGKIQTGRLEAKLADMTWGSVCYNNFDTVQHANRACQIMGYMYGEAESTSAETSSLQTMRYHTNCFWNCDFQLTPAHTCFGQSQFTALRCVNAPVRLKTTQQDVLNVGRVEMYIQGHGWSQVCDENWNSSSSANAFVVCRELGFEDGSALCCNEWGRRGTLPFTTQVSTLGRVENDGRQASTPGGASDDGRRASTPEGASDDGRQVSAPGGAGDDGRQASTPEGASDDGRQASTPGGAGDDGRQVSTPEGASDDGKQTSTPGGAGDDGRQASIPEGASDDGRQASTPGGGSDGDRQASTPEGAGDDGRQASTPGGASDGGRQASTPEGASDDGRQASTPEGASDDGRQVSALGGAGDDGRQASTPEGASDDGRQASTPGGGSDGGRQASTPEGAGDDGRQASTPGGASDGGRQASTPEGASDDGRQASTPEGASDDGRQVSAPGGAGDDGRQASTPGGAGDGSRHASTL